jgi:hypothetical protein
MPQIPLIKWTPQQLADDVAAAIANFRSKRLDEPKERYGQHFKKFSGLVGEIIDELSAMLAEPIDAGLIAKFVRGRDRNKAFRYLTAPPISLDDLETLADTTVGPVVLAGNPEAAARVRNVVRAVIDPHRFPWVAEGREPTPEEKERAIIATAALAATRDVEMDRRSVSKEGQEQAVKDLLGSLGMTKVAPREIPSLSSGSAPAPGEYCGESRVAGTRADVVARLKNGDIMLIECKVSNSSVNSYKRIVHDTGGKAAHWYNSLGRASTIPCAVLGGVFARQNLEHVQNMDVYLFWEHRLQDLADYVNRVSEKPI